MHEQIKQASEILKQGGIVIFPTDTAFGISCRLDDEQAVRRLFALRKRPQNKAVPVLVSSFKMAQRYLSPISKEVKEKLMDRYWPGQLTIVLPCLVEKVPALVRGGRETIGVRMPNHLIPLEILRQLNLPILGPSANFAGGKTPFSFESLDQELIKQADFVIRGECKFKQPSAVIDCSQTPWKVLREGGVIIKV